MDHYKHGLSSIFWGLLLVFLNFDINGVSILPNFIGYLLVLSGLREVLKEDIGVKSIIPWTNVLIVISAISWFTSFIRTDHLPGMTQQVGFITVDLPVMNWFFITDEIEKVITLLFVVLLMNYFIHLIQKSSETEWVIIFKRRKNFYIIINVLMLFGLPFFIMFPAWFGIVFSVLLLLGFIAFIKVIMTAYRMKKLFENDEMIEQDKGGKEDFSQKPCFIQRKKLTIAAFCILILSWAGSIAWIEQWHLEEPLLLPAYIATIGDDHSNVYYLHNGRAEQDGFFMNHFYHFQSNTVFVDSYFSIDQLYFPPEDISSLRGLSQGELILYDGTVLKNNEQLYIIDLPKLDTDPFEYLKLQTGTGNPDGYILTFKVQKPFKMIDELALPFTKQLQDYFTYSWQVESAEETERSNKEYNEGDVITFSISPKDNENYIQLATFQAPIRIIVDGGDGEEVMDVGWVEHYPSYDFNAIQEYVRKFRE
ncbi:hypothetical protein [Alkalihalobacterium alkalinitrilicum]|uniref:hypothetical protein n=1 Tax=Alkalihalobacterium alkalinitrilicum TaxID=427920 RepID=UPI000995D228|nr:hypothetical protein [Alkalihalobacterium alkalinitrilicum]